MVDDYAPAVLDDEEEERKKQPYPPVAAPRPVESTTSMAYPSTLAEPSIPPVSSGDYLGQEGASRMSLVRPTPQRTEYAVPEPHGWAKFGHLAASFNPETNEMFNKAPTA